MESNQKVLTRRKNYFWKSQKWREKCANDKSPLKLINAAENSIKQFNKNDNKILIGLGYAEKKKIDGSKLL